MKNRFLSFVICALCFIFSLAVNVSNLHASGGYELYIAQGIDLLNENKFNEALDVLKKAIALSPDNLEARYYTGVAYTKLGDIDEAERLFSGILNDDNSFTNAHLELGRIYYIQSKCAKSKNHLSSFIELTDSASLKEYASGMMDTCGAEAGKKEEKKYHLYVSGGYQYDDNVIVEPSNPAPSSETKSDSRVIAYVSADAELLEKGPVTLKADYKFYQSFHFSIDEYDMHYHNIKPSLHFDLSDVVKPSIAYSYEYTSLGSDRYSGVSTFHADLVVKEGDNHSTKLQYKFRDLKYWNSDLFAANSIRSGEENIVGIKQIYKKDKFRGDIHLIGDYNRADRDDWSYNGYTVGVELSYNITNPLYLTVLGEYSENRYRAVSPLSPDKRKDKMQKYSIVLAYKITDVISVYVSDEYTDNDSNLTLFEYQRNIVGVYVMLSAF